MRTILFLSVLLVSLNLYAQNPFEKWGYKPRIATYSQGQFNEFFDQDTIVQIGSVLINTNSFEIVAFVEVDTVYSEATLEPDIVSRWLSPDPLAAKYPAHSPYVFVNNNPLILVDPDGREWVNAYTAERQRLEKAAINNPDDNKIKRQLRRVQRSEERVNQYINDIKTNDVALYNYIENLQVEDNSGNKRNVKVYVSSNPAVNGPNREEATTRWERYTEKPNVKYGNKQIVAPKATNGTPSFDITVYGTSSTGDERLSNEAGDIMYYMEHNKDAISEKSNSAFFESGGGGMDAYLNSGSGSYSQNVQDTYTQRKKDGTGKNSSSNPYPLPK